MSDSDHDGLVKQAQMGDPRAFDTLVRRFQNRSVAYARCILRDPELAEDAAQEAFLQAWFDLPALRQPAAFGSWLRRIVFKHCDRIRRQRHIPLVSLDLAAILAGGVDPARLAETEADAGVVRAAFDRLPEREREAAMLYYLGERDVAETASFLGLPPTTVKNRLHAARKRLRKELFEMAEAILEREKPSRDEAFSGNVLARIADEFQRQMRADPHTADRNLLGEGREKLEAILARPGEIDWETACAGVDLLDLQNDRRAVAALLMRIVAQKLDDSQAAWAYYHLSNSLARTGDAAGAVLAFEAFERRLPGTTARLAASGSSLPLAPGETGVAYEGEADIRLFQLGKSGEFADAWFAVWRGDEYLDRIDTALAQATPTDANRDLRFYCLRMAESRSGSHGYMTRARGYIAQMYALADEPQPESDRGHWRAKAMGHDLSARKAEGDIAGYDALLLEREALLATAEGKWVVGERHNLAFDLAWADHSEAALALLDQNLAAGGHANSWAYVMHAAVLWKTTHDRERALALLREAPARENRDMTYFFVTLAQFADVRDDPEFLAAVQGPPASAPPVETGGN